MELANIQIADREEITNARNHVAQHLTAEHIESADLILGLAREHRRYVVELVPAATRRTFTLREFARLAELENSANDRSEDVFGRSKFSFVDDVASRRGQLPALLDPTDDDVVDPYRLGPDVFIQQAREILPAVEVVAELIRESVREA